SRTRQRIRALRELGWTVDVISTNRPGRTFEDRARLSDRIRYRLRRPRDEGGANEALLAAVRQNCDLVWVENALALNAATLTTVKRLVPRSPLIWYSEDDMMTPRLGS